jgi:hypothetical protein
MDEQTARRLFIGFLALIVGAALGGGLVMFCARPASSAPAATAVSKPAPAASTADAGSPLPYFVGAASAPIAPLRQMG